MKTDKVLLWMGEPVSDLRKDELAAVINYCDNEIARLTRERDRYRDARDVVKYLAERG